MMINTIGARGLVGAVFLALATSAASGAESGPPPATDLQIAGPVLMVVDIERSVRFYTEGLGLVVGSRLGGNPGPGATVVAPNSGSSPFVLLRQRGPAAVTEPPIEVGKGLSRIMLSVGNAQAVAARLRSAGYDPGALNARNIFFVTDPDGYRYEVIQRAAAR